MIEINLGDIYRGRFEGGASLERNPLFLQKHRCAPLFLQKQACVCVSTQAPPFFSLKKKFVPPIEILGFAPDLGSYAKKS